MTDPIMLDRRRLLGAATAALAAGRLGILGTALAQASCAALGTSNGRELPPFDGATQWLNSPPLTPTALRGKVVLVQFWTYTCINWLRTEPYVRAWAERYRDGGLVVVGVHSPEFEFEKDIANVRPAATRLRVEYPIAVDSGMAIWRAFDNAYWPALYLADASGRIRYDHFGEGKYDQTETMIQRLLAEAGGRATGDERARVDARGIEAPADWDDLQTAETYVGFSRMENFASPGGGAYAERRSYSIPAQLASGQWALAGDWTMHGQATSLNAGAGRIAYRFHARDLHLVMGPAARGESVRFRVRLDGMPPGAAHGLDVDEQGNGTLVEQRLYQLIRQPQPIADRLFEIEFPDAGAEAFSFTFG